MLQAAISNCNLKDMEIKDNMKKAMRVGITVLLTLCFCILGFTACGEKTGEDGDKRKGKAKDEVEATISSVTLNKDGSISSRIVEDFGESYYDTDGLKSMIEASISEYTSGDKAAQVKLKSCKASGGRVTVVMEFGDYSSYAGFNDEDFFTGTIQAANQAGFDLNITLQAASDKADKTTISKPELLGMGDKHIAIIDTANMADTGEDQTIRVSCFGDILYVGDGVTVAGKKSADVALTGGYGIIVFK